MPARGRKTPATPTILPFICLPSRFWPGHQPSCPVIVVNASFAVAIASTLPDSAALLAVIVATGIILAGLSVQYVIDGLTAIGIVVP